MFHFKVILFSLALMSGPGMAQAQAQAFDPNEGCYKLLSQGSDTDKLMISAWAIGYLAASQNDVIPVSIPNATTVLGNLVEACLDDSQRSLVELVSSSRKPTGPGSQEDARAFLAQFLAPGADLVALTAGMMPTPADVAAVYQEPLASKLVEIYADLFTPGLALGPKPGQDSLLVVHASTDNLIDGDAVLSQFPGGYERVLPFLKPGVPIVRFKFVTAGETSGLAFDGLVFLDGRWVLLPKPWRGLN